MARIGSFTRAAEQAHMTQAGLSTLVREMERQLGCRLFDRTTRMVELTPAGRRLLPVAERVVTDLENVTRNLGAEGDAARQTLRIAATPLVSSHLLPQVFDRFRATHPAVTLRLFDADLRTVEAMVLASEADLGLGSFFRSVPGLERSAVGRFHLMRVAPADAPPRDTPIGSAPWSALRSVDLLGLPQSNPIQKLIDSQLVAIRPGRFEPHCVQLFRHPDLDGRGGFGTAVMPTFALAACRRHRVRTDVLVKPRVSLDFFRVTRRGTGEGEALAAFSDTLAKALPELSR